MAYTLLSPHISSLGLSDPQTDGRSGCPKIRHRSSAPSCTHRTPAGLPCGIPGIGLEIDGAMQHAPQSGRQARAETGAGSRTVMARLGVYAGRAADKLVK
jgi:hypothetical protein